MERLDFLEQKIFGKTLNWANEPSKLHEFVRQHFSDIAFSENWEELLILIRKLKSGKSSTPRKVAKSARLLNKPEDNVNPPEVDLPIREAHDNEPALVGNEELAIDDGNFVMDAVNAQPELEEEVIDAVNAQPELEEEVMDAVNAPDLEEEVMDVDDAQPLLEDIVDADPVDPILEDNAAADPVDPTLRIMLLQIP
ncbi:hypothetical protein TNIN_7411 [Trichonephila inaurata madagascariensis]|uniref:Uncharacterized protein n=1 Tax=Trichonephila inaurata madagascariensis TaxID=2747483 RepID=A0A8X6WSI3_9ARAC|nr:hypothetical protein TNIN_7411 [Trichonephila inaurata madagascariensis]